MREELTISPADFNVQSGTEASGSLEEAEETLERVPDSPSVETVYLKLIKIGMELEISTINRPNAYKYGLYIRSAKYDQIG